MSLNRWMGVIDEPFEPIIAPISSRLTEKQQLVVEADRKEHQVVVAPAGAGKTHALCNRIHYLVEEESVPAEQILVLYLSLMYFPCKLLVTLIKIKKMKVVSQI